jgi:hypothetical protein
VSWITKNRFINGGEKKMELTDVAENNRTGNQQDDELLSIADGDCIADVVNREYQEII